jgi:hypothetical protein
MRNRIISASCALLGASLLAAAPALANPSVSVQVPASASPNTVVNVVYSGVADTGPVAVTESASMTLLVFYERNAASCAATAAAQRASAGSQFDAQQFIEAPAPFSFTSTLQFAAAGAYRFCAYLETNPAVDTAAPAAFAQAVLQVGAPTPCTVPQLSNLTLAAATKKLTSAGCALGKVTKPKRAGRKKLVVRSQSEPAGTALGLGAKVNLTLKVKK